MTNDNNGHGASIRSLRDKAMTEQLLAELERLTGRKVVVSDEPPETVALLKEQEELRRKAATYYSHLELVIDDLKCNSDAQGIAGALEALWEIEPFDVELTPGRDYGMTESPGKSLGSVRITSEVHWLDITARGHGETLAEALSAALDTTLTHLGCIATGEPQPKPEIPF